MARSQCPSTPFSTPLSGSARQAEARIRNLFQGPKRRPPVWLMVLVLLLILSCGGLVACQDQKVPPEKAEISALSASATSQPLSSEDLHLVDALYGAAAALEGISLRLEEELGPVTVVLTGGHGRDILPLLRRAVEYEPHLQLMGLRELWLRSL